MKLSILALLLGLSVSASGAEIVKGKYLKTYKSVYAAVVNNEELKRCSLSFKAIVQVIGEISTGEVIARVSEYGKSYPTLGTTPTYTTG